MKKTDAINFFRFCLLIFLFLISFRSTFAQSLNDDFLLVESVPKETKLEESKLPRTLDVWLNMINNAGRSIDFEMFYFSNNKNSSLVSIFDAIKSAAGRGVQIRIIVDSSFYAKNDHSSDELEGIQNITIRKIPYVNLGGGIMHAKYFIVDGETLFMGSQNMDWRAVEHIHEIGVMVKNKSFVSTFQKIFDLDWNYCVSKGDTPLESLNKSKKKIVNSKNHILINSDYYGKVNIYPAFSPYDYTPKKFSKEEKEIVKLIGNTKTKLCIQIYSFSDKIYKEEKKFDSFYKALKKAAKRGVDIKIIMPDWATEKIYQRLKTYKLKSVPYPNTARDLFHLQELNIVSILLVTIKYLL